MFIIFFFLIEVIITLVSQGLDFSFNSTLVNFLLVHKCLGAFQSLKQFIN